VLIVGYFSHFYVGDTTVSLGAALGSRQVIRLVHMHNSVVRCWRTSVAYRLEIEVYTPLGKLLEYS